ncbi:VOC family protein [Streptomyces libani]|uniref:Glyoxalase n=2 Tax=Streptomyces nigrescens TaxID=1920 RepID=A0A640TNA4_STRNI|nr:MULTISPECIES: VOC family protein [Streptomyces]MCW7984180.1 glyoxalase [Streptomyces platensis subsp. clarensis]AWN27013.1 glyoxalase [Streptomyces sp. NEAU-S7GS2]MCX5449255.1 VOC family protein [Streptomyces libani]MYT12788.1 VOC family protein [Streptomyces sp. SID4951]MYX05630.1 VOC family protein [Streptomyces sp. SID8375]
MSVRRLNHAVLNVRDVPRSVAFYTEALGLTVDVEIPGRAAFLSAPGSHNDHDLGLFAVAPDAPGPEAGRVGLYHLAWEVGTLGELVAARTRLTERGALVGSSDHLVAKSLYAKDPDGNEFEVMWRVPREDWPGPDLPDRLLPLDLGAALERWGPDRETGAAAGSAT